MATAVLCVGLEDGKTSSFPGDLNPGLEYSCFAIPIRQPYVSAFPLSQQSTEGVFDVFKNLCWRECGCLVRFCSPFGCVGLVAFGFRQYFLELV